jgi:hypothetical protein
MGACAGLFKLLKVIEMANNEIRKAHIGDLIFDNRNANQGTERGDFMLTQSLERLGAGRSVLLDKAGRLIAGNKTAAKFGELGLDDVVIVPTDGKTLIAVQRTDLDIDSPEGREMALADNRVGEINLSWDVETLQGYADDGVDVGDWFTPDEMAGWDVENNSIPDYNPESSTEEIDVESFEFDCKCPKCGFEFIQQK